MLPQAKNLWFATNAFFLLACTRPPPFPFKQDAARAIAPSDTRPDLAQNEDHSPTPAIERPLGSACTSDNRCSIGQCVLELCSEWPNALRLQIDTSSTGARLAAAVTDFPLLVRLRPDSPAFEGARADGADLRFTDDHNVTLPHEIESWQPLQKTGALWVRIPTVKPNHATQSIYLFWGNPRSVTTSTRSAVFKNHTFVFHMATAPDEKNSFSSSTAIPSTLSQDGASTTLPSEIAGQALSLDGNTGPWLTTPSTNQDPVFSLSFWFQSLTGDGGGLAEVFAADPSTRPGRDHVIWLDRGGRLSFAIQSEERWSAISNLPTSSDGQWHQVFTTVTAMGQRLYVDGELVADDPSITQVVPMHGSWSLGAGDVVLWPDALPLIPRAATNRFVGNLDEIRLTNQPRSEAWIKLSYAVERPGSTVVTAIPVP